MAPRAASGPPVALALVLAAALVLQLPALRTPFFADDYLFLDQVSRGSLAEVLAAPDPIGNFYRPVGRQLCFWLLARAGGGSPFVFHAFNLALWLAVVGLLYAVARRAAGAHAGLIAAGLIALHYAADVPVRWASGSQDLIAVAGALGAIRLHLAGRSLLAGVTLVVALLSKETVVLTPLVAAIAGRGPGEPWRAAARRAWPLAAAVALWALIVWSATHGRAAEPGRLTVTPAAAAAAVVHLVQVAAAIEWTSLGPSLTKVLPMLVPLALVLLAIVADRSHVAAPARAPGGAPPGVADTRRGAGSAKQPGGRSSARAGRGDRGKAGRGNPARAGIFAGLVWAAAGAAPIAPVAGIWSAYYYLFALCGVALALGAWLAGRPRAWTMIVVAVLALNSARSGALPQHALVRGAWTTCSHVNRQYIERGTQSVQRYLGHLLAARPTLPARSTLFFGGVPGAIAFQTADGPLVRWAYRDTSLRSYFLNSFDRVKAGRGPTFFFEVRRDSLCDVTAEPGHFLRVALGALLGGKPESASEMLHMERERDPGSRSADYWLAWVDWDLGEREKALAALEAAGFQARAGPAPETQRALQTVMAGDTARAIEIARRGMETHVLDAASHALLADLTVAVGRNHSFGVIEAYAARLLAPEWPLTWRRWAMLQAQYTRYLESAVSLRRYFDLGGAAARSDSEAQTLAQSLRVNYPVTVPVLDGVASTGATR